MLIYTLSTTQVVSRLHATALNRPLNVCFHLNVTKMHDEANSFTKAKFGNDIINRGSRKNRKISTYFIFVVFRDFPQVFDPTLPVFLIQYHYM